MAIVSRDAMKQIIETGMDQMFEEEYRNWVYADYNRIEMPRRGRYQVWQGHKMVADKIRHRREALAMMKLLMENDDGNS